MSTSTRNRVTITISRDLARPLGILERETDVHLNRSDFGWLAYNIKHRMSQSDRVCLAAKIYNQVNADLSEMNKAYGQAVVVAKADNKLRTKLIAENKAMIAPKKVFN